MPEFIPSTEDGIRYAAEALIRGFVVAFPTETVYGLGGNAYDDGAVSRLFFCKGRPKAKPLSVCYPSFDKVTGDAEVDDRARIFAEKFMPGPVTLVLRKKNGTRLSCLGLAGQETVGIRVPADSTAQKLLSMLPFPLAVPSANMSGGASPSRAQQVFENFKQNRELIILDGGTCKIGIPSTVIDLVEGKILRHGAVAAPAIEELLRKLAYRLLTNSP
ncbi:MAG: threonylcarbamoyl-AMP synthase [Holosporaceae bacterium]|jgi:L-threonylcarbamoyladenylate synthase|nr:threonylcarbamoyl-AMP synthase [Holosporaceae bacterium]